METLDVALRLIAATVAGGALGINRDLHAKPTGVRTLGLVSLGAAIATLAGIEIAGGEGATRVMQGVLTGIGFLGAGVIMRPAAGFHIHGLTTAAATWLTACIGIVCGVGSWRVLGFGLVLAFLLLIFGGPLEKVLRRNLGQKDDDS